MLNAVLHGKAGRLPGGVKPGDSLRSVFRHSEDILTAMVFGRLAYLDDALLWRILKETFKQSPLPDRRMVKLESITFWPWWENAREEIGQAVEPDVHLRFSVGEPAETWNLIVECKLNGPQYADQWAREWQSHAAEEGLDRRPDKICLLAIGGVSAQAGRDVARLTTDIRDRYGLEISAAVADWSHLLKTLETIEWPDDVASRLRSDIIAALNLYGYRSVRPMSDLTKIAKDYSIQASSFDALNRLREEASIVPFAADWPAQVAPFRPIAGHPTLQRRIHDVG